jgi:hypothetical protein
VTIHTGRQSAPTLLVLGRRIAEARAQVAQSWSSWIADGQNGGAALEPGDLDRPLRLVLDLLSHMSGSLRHEARESWFAATEMYGRLAEARGLSAGEVVEEFQHLRELLIVALGDIIAALPARQQLPAVLRLNRVMDTGVANAVVGYTDALVAKMFSRDGVPVPTADSVQELLGQMHALEADVKLLDERADH